MSIEALKMSLENGEALLAVVGLDNVLNTKKVKIKQSQIKQVANINTTIYDMCKEFLLQPEFKPIKLHSLQINLFEVLEQMGKLADVEALTAKFEPLEDTELQEQMISQLSRAVAYLQNLAPKFSNAFRKRSPSDFQASRFNRVYRTIAEPLSVLTDLQMGCLSREQVKTIQAVYPELYKIIMTNFNQAGIDITMKDPAYQVSYKKLKMIAVLTLQNNTPAGLAEALQANFATKEAGQEIGSSGFVDASTKDKTATALQKIEFK